MTLEPEHDDRINTIGNNAATKCAELGMTPLLFHRGWVIHVAVAVIQAGEGWVARDRSPSEG